MNSFSLQDSAIKTLEISLAQKTEELVEFEQRLRKLQEEKILLLREKQELSKQVEALEEQVNLFTVAWLKNTYADYFDYM